MADEKVTPTISAPIPAIGSSPSNALKWVGLMLALSVGGNAYLWHLWRLDETATQVMGQSSRELQTLQIQVQELQRLITTVDQWRGDLESLRIQVQELQRLKTKVDQWSSDLESLRKASEGGRIEMEALKMEIKRLQDGRIAYEALMQKQLQTAQEQWTRQLDNQQRNEVNW